MSVSQIDDSLGRDRISCDFGLGREIRSTEVAFPTAQAALEPI